MIQLYIPYEKFEIKTQDRTLNKNNNPGLVFYDFFFKVNNMKY